MELDFFFFDDAKYKATKDQTENRKPKNKKQKHPTQNLRRFSIIKFSQTMLKEKEEEETSLEKK